MSTLTTNYSFIKPSVFGDADLWGGYLNTSLDLIDTQVKTTDNFAQAALPKAGGTMSGNIAMGGFKLTGLVAGTAATDSVAVSQNQSNIAGHAFSTGGTVDAMTVVMSPVTTVYSTHFFYRITSLGPNTITAPTINVDGIGVKTLKKLGSVALAVGDTGAAGTELLIGYNGTSLLLLNPPSIAPAVTLGANTFTGVQTFTKSTIQAKGASVASAATTSIWSAADGDSIHITGTTGTTSYGTAPQAGAKMHLIYDGIVPITTGANLLIKGVTSGAVYTTAAGDEIDVFADTTTAMLLEVKKANGQPVQQVSSFVSTGIATTAAAGGAIAHGLGIKPTKLMVEMICTTIDVGYAVNDKVVVSVNNAATTGGLSVWMDATNINYRNGSGGTQFIFHKTTGVSTATTAANWSLIFTASL